MGVPDLTTDFAYVYFAIGIFKLLLNTLLAAMLVFGRVGPGGLQYTTFVWRYPVGVTLFLDAFLAALGGFGLITTKRYGPVLLAISFGLDVLLLGWLVYNIVTDRLVVWPDSGPYVFLAFFCTFCLVENIIKARRFQPK
jgi:hypothetical protein